MINNEKKICIIGTGGFGRETLLCIIDKIGASDVKVEEAACFMVEDKNLVESKIMGVRVIPQSKFEPKLYDVVVAIGDPSTRKKVVESLPNETTFKTVIHPNAIISKWVQIGEGSIITAGVSITCNIKIGKHSQLNLNTTIGHFVNIGKKCFVGSSAHITKNVKSNSVVVQNDSKKISFDPVKFLEINNFK